MKKNFVLIIFAFLDVNFGLEHDFDLNSEENLLLTTFFK